MKISVLGFGHVGSQLTRLWSAAGHTLQVGLREGSRNEEAVRKLNIEVLQPKLAAKSAEIVVLALPWESVEETLTSLGPLNGQVIIDATNPLNRDLSIIIPPMGSGGQQIAKWAPGARVVKAFNTIGAAYFGNPSFDMYYCSDDSGAADVVRGLIEDVAMRPVNVGPLKNASYLEHMAALWIDLAINGRVQGPFGFNLVKGDVH